MLNIGDRVRVSADYFRPEIVGKEGVVVEVKGACSVCVAFKGFAGGHNGPYEDRFRADCWYLDPVYLENMTKLSGVNEVDTAEDTVQSNIGDRVRVSADYFRPEIVGKEGVVVELMGAGLVCVMLESFASGHNGPFEGRARADCWYLDPVYLEKMTKLSAVEALDKETAALQSIVTTLERLGDAVAAERVAEYVRERFVTF